MIRKRGNTLEVVVYVGRDPVTRKSKKVSRTVRGITRESHRRARQIESELAAQVADGRSFDEANATLGELLDRWLEVAHLESSTEYQARRALARYVRPKLGHVRVNRLRAAQIDELYSALLAGSTDQRALAATTVHHVHTYLRAALNLAVRWDWIAKNPATGASPPPEGPTEPDPPSLEQLVAILAKAEEVDAPMAMLVRLAAMTGMRRGELCALRRSDLELDDGIIRKRHAVSVGSLGAYVKSTKTGARHAVALAPPTIDRLRAHLTGQDATAAVFGSTVGEEGFVFSHDDDCETPWHPQWVSRRFRQICEMVSEAKSVQLRSLRHWMITQGLDAGASVKAVAGRASHARASTTLDRYAAWIPASDRDLAETIENLLRLPASR